MRIGMDVVTPDGPGEVTHPQYDGMDSPAGSIVGWWVKFPGGTRCVYRPDEIVIPTQEVSASAA